MSEPPKCTWTGKTGTTYTFEVWSLPANIKEGQDGNYIFAKAVTDNWVPIYIGQGDLGERTNGSHHQQKCIDSKGATHVHVHLNAREEIRLAEEEDLLANYTNAYVPAGCNVKKGG